MTGIEPGTGFPYNRGVERRFGRVPALGPGESREFSLRFDLLDSAEAVVQSQERIRALAMGTRTRIQTTPEADPDAEQ